MRSLARRTAKASAAVPVESDAGWLEAVAECDVVLHVASPFPMGAPKHEDELIIPAREGALRVLRAARDAGALPNARPMSLSDCSSVDGYRMCRLTHKIWVKFWSRSFSVSFVRKGGTPQQAATT